VDFFFRHYDSCCYMPERGRIHDAASNASPISPDHETSSDRTDSPQADAARNRRWAVAIGQLGRVSV